MNAPSLAARIRGDIERQIVSGAWPPGHRIPFEQDLATQYGCSRMTVNKVLSALTTAGLIIRRRKAGSFVSVPRGEHALMQIEDFTQQAARQNLPYRHEILARAVVGTELRIDCRHRIGAAIVAWERRRISLTAVPEAAAVDFARIPPGTWLLHSVPWSEAEHVIGARNADAMLAAALDIPQGTACLVMERRTWHLGAWVTQVDIAYPGERHRFVGRFSPTGDVVQASRHRPEPNGVTSS
jgi:GntR family histidine utilization transcriptional repressor